MISDFCWFKEILYESNIPLQIILINKISYLVLSKVIPFKLSKNIIDNEIFLSYI